MAKLQTAVGGKSFGHTASAALAAKGRSGGEAGGGGGGRRSIGSKSASVPNMKKGSSMLYAVEDGGDQTQLPSSQGSRMGTVFEGLGDTDVAARPSTADADSPFAETKEKDTPPVCLRWAVAKIDKLLLCCQLVKKRMGDQQ